MWGFIIRKFWERVGKSYINLMESLIEYKKSQ